jgi:hypothetical protein
VAADGGVGNAEPVEDPQRLPVLAGSDDHLVPLSLQALDQRPQDERVRRRRAVDPDQHAATLCIADGKNSLA